MTETATTASEGQYLAYGLIAEEVRACLRAGREPDVEGLAERYPDLAESIRHLVPTLALVQQLGHESDPDGSAADRPEFLGDFRIVREVGRGGMGVVYEAVQRSLGRRVALKVLPFAATIDPKHLQRFHNEAKVAAGLRHEHIVHVYGVGCERGVHYYAMEFVEGQSLAQVIAGMRGEVGSEQPNAHATATYTPAGSPVAGLCEAGRGSQTPATEEVAVLSTLRTGNDRAHHRRLAELIAQAADALEYAHSMGIVHRDVKPANLLLDGAGKLYVSDFGLARLGADAGLTLSGDLVGTLRYMSPEQARAKHNLVDHRTDVYSLGVTFYELLTLRPAFDGDDPQELLRQVANAEPVPPRRLNRAVPGELETVALKAMAKEPSHRYQSAGEMAEDLRRFLAGQPVRARRVSQAERTWRLCRRNPLISSLIATVVVLAVAGFAGVFGQWQVALANAQKANEHAAQTEKERDEVRALNDRLRSTLYASHMNLAKHAWDEAGVPRMRELLEQLRPKAGETDLRGFEWYYLNRLCQSELLTLKVQAGPGGRVAFSPDGKRLASAARNGTVKVWDAQTGQELLDLRGGGHREVAFSPDGKRLASPSADNMVVKVWDAQTGQELLSLKGHTGNVTSVAFSPDGKRLATGSGDNTAKVWDAQTGRELLTIKGGLYSVTFSPDSKRLASASGDNTVGVKVWDAQTGQELLSVKAGGSSVAFSPDGKRLVISRGGGVRVWDAQTGQELLDLKGHAGQVSGVAYSPDGKRIASAGGDRTVKVWDAQTGQQLFTFLGHTNMVSSVAFNPDGTRLASTAMDGTVKVWDATTSPEARTFSRPPFSVGAVAFSPDGKRLASDGAIWDATTQTAVAPELKVWDAQTGQELLSIKGNVGCVGFSPDGKRLAGTDDNATVKVWDAQTGQELLALKGHTAVVRSVVFRPDGKRLASVSGSRQGGVALGEVKVWDAQTGQELLSIKGNIGRLGRVAFSPDGQRLASHSGGEVKVWDAQTGQELLALKGGGNCVAFSPDGKRLASNSRASDSNAFPGAIGEVKVWDAQTGQELLTLKGHTAQVFSVAFSPDGKRLASGSTNVTGGQNGEVKVWDTQTGQELLTLKGASTRLAFSPDGKRLASNADGSLKIYDATPLPEKP